MRPGPRIQTAIEILDAVFAAGAPADSVISRQTRKRRYMGSKDRRAVTGLVWTVLRNRATLSWRLNHAPETPPAARTMMLVHLALSDPDGLDLFTGDTHAPAPLSAEEKALAERMKDGDNDDPAMPAFIRQEMPEWLYRAFHARFGDKTDAVCAAMNTQAMTDLRINPLVCTRETAKSTLNTEGYNVERTAFSPFGLRFEGRKNLSDTDLFKKGGIEIQDEGSQIIGLLTGATPGMDVMDYCAGAGGKSLVLAAMMKDTGTLYACDVRVSALREAKTRIKRAGVKSVSLHLIKGGRPVFEDHSGTFDRVLVDAPCSGTGTGRRNPDARWQLSSDDIEGYAKRQAEILQTASAFVKPGGRLVYATCSLLKPENEAVADAFTDRTSDTFTPLPVSRLWTESIPDAAFFETATDTPYLLLDPFRHKTDGYFIAVWERM